MVVIIVLIIGGVGYVFLRKAPQEQKNMEEVNVRSNDYTGGSQSNETKSSSSMVAATKKSSSSKTVSVPKTGTSGGTTGRQSTLGRLSNWAET